jgi:hypothetical protein
MTVDFGHIIRTNLHVLVFADSNLNFIHFIDVEIKFTESDSICFMCYQHTNMDPSRINILTRIITNDMIVYMVRTFNVTYRNYHKTHLQVNTKLLELYKFLCSPLL